MRWDIITNSWNTKISQQVEIAQIKKFSAAVPDFWKILQNIYTQDG